LKFYENETHAAETETTPRLGLQPRLLPRLTDPTRGNN